MSRRPEPWFRFARESRNRGSGRGCTGHRERRDVRTNAERQAVEFEVEIGEYRGVVHPATRVSTPPRPDRPTPERCVEAHDLQRTRFESIAERRLLRRQLTEDGNIEMFSECASLEGMGLP